MANAFLRIAATPAVKTAQEANGSRHAYARLEGGPLQNHRLGAAEEAFIAARDSFYMATVSETGWPYVQHRGGPPGFLVALDERTLGIGDLRGNKQYITLGNIAGDARCCLFLIDYPARRRLKIYARVEARRIDDDPAQAQRLLVPPMRGAERALIFHVEAFDWNCPQHITPRFTEAEVNAAVAPLRGQLARLEDENAALRAALAKQEQPK